MSSIFRSVRPSLGLVRCSYIAPILTVTDGFTFDVLAVKFSNYYVMFQLQISVSAKF